MQGGRWKAGGVLKTTWNGGRAFGTGKLAVITREQQETRGLLVAGQGAMRLGIKEGHFNQVVQDIFYCLIVWFLPGVVGCAQLIEKCTFLSFG